MSTLVDSNIIIDLFSEDEEWFDWSSAMLSESALRGRLVINPVVYAEVCCAYDTLEAVEAAVPPHYFAREVIPWPASFLASRAFLQYRRRGGARRSPLPDFFIGAHAAVAGYTLLTRDATRYRTYFPKLRVIAP